MFYCCGCVAVVDLVTCQVFIIYIYISIIFIFVLFATTNYELPLSSPNVLLVRSVRRICRVVGCDDIILSLSLSHTRHSQILFCSFVIISLSLSLLGIHILYNTAFFKPNAILCGQLHCTLLWMGVTSWFSHGELCALKVVNTSEGKREFLNPTVRFLWTHLHHQVSVFKETTSFLALMRLFLEWVWMTYVHSRHIYLNPYTCFYYVILFDSGLVFSYCIFIYIYHTACVEWC